MAATTPFVNALVSGQLANTPSNPIYAANHPAPASNQGVYWVGADNNIYTKAAGQNGVKNVGPVGVAAIPKGLTQIANPNPPKSGGGSSSGDSGNSGSAYGSDSGNSYSSGGSGTQYADKSNDITLQNAGLGSVGDTENSGVKAIEDAWGKINGQYNDDLTTAATEYGNESTTNTQDLQTNKQTALERGVSGRQGLFGTLASIGALNGSGIDLANRAVQKGANEDLTTAADTFATNQNGLDTGYSAYKQQEKRLQDAATTAKDNNEQQVHNDAARSRQQYLTNLANDYQAEGNTEQAKNFASQAAALFPSIASTNVPTINMGYSGGAYTAPTLNQYVGKANNTTVQATPGANAGSNNFFNIPGLVALNKKQAA